MKYIIISLALLLASPAAALPEFFDYEKNEQWNKNICEYSKGFWERGNPRRGRKLLRDRDFLYSRDINPRFYYICDLGYKNGERNVVHVWFENSKVSAVLEQTYYKTWNAREDAWYELIRDLNHDYGFVRIWEDTYQTADKSFMISLDRISARRGGKKRIYGIEIFHVRTNDE